MKKLVRFLFLALVSVTISSSAFAFNFSNSETRKTFLEIVDESLRTGTRIFDNHKLYELSERNLSDTEELLKRWYPHNHIDGMIDEVKLLLGPKCIPILLDPGVVAHFDELTHFVKKNSPVPEREPWPLRRRFSESLGSKTVYRGLSLTAEQLAGLKVHGVRAPYLENQKENLQDVYKFFLDQFSTHPSEDSIHAAKSLGIALSPIEEVENRRVHQLYPKTWGYMSLSYYPDVASSVGSQESDNFKKPYLLELKVPALSVIEVKGPFAIFSPSSSDLFYSSTKILEEALKNLILTSRPSVCQEPFYSLPDEAQQLHESDLLSCTHFEGDGCGPPARREGHPVYLLGGIDESKYVVRSPFISFSDLGVEVFIPYILSTSEIVSITHISHAPTLLFKKSGSKRD